ncbi:MAG: HDIG domain-containing protein [Treponema sp.]|jgi:putative nucleotidyltransferase with HDIG domain|nr:HDIG domain-containing protein [Treponema sp.]
MRTKKSRAPKSLGKANPSLLRVTFPAIRPGPAISTVIALLISTVVVINIMNSRGGAGGDIEEFEVGRVAERDVIAEQMVSYIDEGATRFRLEAQERLVPAVFRYASAEGIESHKGYNRFVALSRQCFENDASFDAYKLAIQAEFPGVFSEETLHTLFSDPQREQFLEAGSFVMEHFMETGIFALPQTNLDGYNPDILEVRRSSASQVERERVNCNHIITMDTLEDAVGRYVAAGSFPGAFTVIAYDLVKPFIRENVFFAPRDTDQQVAETRSQVEPVVKYIEPGERVIKKGFIITEEDMAQLRALHTSLPGQDPRIVVGFVLVFLLLYSLFVFLGSGKIAGHILTDQEIYLLSALATLYICGAAFAKNLSFNSDFFPVSIVLPTALVVMLPAILIDAPLALALSMVLPLGAFLSGSFDVPAYIFALTSGIVASYALEGAEKRMDLVRAGLIIAAANCIAVIAVLLIQRASGGAYPAILFWAAFNGVASGMLVLGLLPPLEHALNAATVFRLIELSDLNSPMLKRLFNTAPGTYSHSIMVANLAETACQEIGANPLLARVGAYYHDIGKMDQPDYFVENQSEYNKHNDIAPRLSATIIRSHVKLGVEKARSLGLPRAVRDIVAEHHGNSVITWFYSEALKRESQVNMEDFSYPGNPPRSRESAVVMLADVTEAAVRTLQKPNAQKFEKFIQELINAKVEHGQLAESELTFRDLETIKKAFVRVLTGYYHSRIEYPKLPKAALAPQGGGE